MTDIKTFWSTVKLLFPDKVGSNTGKTYSENEQIS